MLVRLLALLCVLTQCVCAQVSSSTMYMGGPAADFTQNLLRHTGSGTSLEPSSSAPAMVMQMRPSGWMLMLHGEASAVEQQQTGPRGRDKFFAVNWLMPMAQKNTGKGEFTLRTMLSLEPATITGRYYPELFQEGETAFGRPIVDGQHPHNLFMEIAGLYDRKFGEHLLLGMYAAPVGDPALGPQAYPHRASIGDDPLAPLGHHLEDSTHIADDVLTGSIAWGQDNRGARIEASGFHGREPDENRWHIAQGALDSWSTRLSAAPARDWSVQYSLGHLHSPEVSHPEEDVLRQTASIAYHRATPVGALNAIAVWGRNHSIGTSTNTNGYLFEGALRSAKQTVWTRIENADRTTDLLGSFAPAEEGIAGRVQAYTGGYAHHVWGKEQVSAELGGQITGYGVPSALRPLYGDHSLGVAAVLQFRLGKGEQ